LKPDVTVTNLPDNLKSKVIAVAVFGDPYRLSSSAWPVNNPTSNVISFCNFGDPVCLNGYNGAAHLAYATDGSVTRASAFIASKFT
jgi:cutinase